jgi:hypothetical protein
MKQFTIKISFPEHRDQILFIKAAHIGTALQRAVSSGGVQDRVGFGFKVLAIKELKLVHKEDLYMED